MSDTIAIRGLDVDCVVGLYPTERVVPQPLRVDVELTLDTRAAAERERLYLSVDYAAIAAQLSFLLRHCRFRMLETAAHVLARYLLAPPALGERRAAIDAVTLRLTKPGALRGLAVPSLEIRREGTPELVREDKPFGTVDVVHETQDAGIYRLNVAPGRGIPLHVHRRMDEAEMVLSDGLLCQGRAVMPLTVHRWPREAPHRYDNPTTRWQTILCVDAPRFLESDEIEVEGEPAVVTPEPPWL
jgi:dihydroneopterin aldolase